MALRLGLGLASLHADVDSTQISSPTRSRSISFPNQNSPLKTKRTLNG
jgi:hypothetical protein